MDILNCILITAEDGEIKLTCNDMDLGIETKIEGIIEEAGNITIDAKKFADIVRKLPNDEVSILSDENNSLKINCLKANFDIIGKSGEEFSYLPDVNKENYFSVSQFNLREIINKTIFSVADNEKNKILTGELFEVKGNNLRVASLDGFRISIRNLELADNYNDIRVIIPGKTLSEVSKILSGDVDDKVNIYCTNNHILFEFDKTIVVSRLIEGEFFKIDKMISNDYETKITVNRLEVIGAIERATVLASEGNSKPIIININEGNINIKMNSYIGSMDEDVSVKMEGNNLMIGFNPKFMLDALRAIEEEDINIYFVNSKSPCYIKNDSLSYIYLIVPVNINTVSN
mgnify:CR=1 FL=1